MWALLTCGPFALTIVAWIKLALDWRHRRPPVTGLVALSVASASAAFSAGTFLYYHLWPPSSSLPPWKDPEILNFALLFMLGPAGMILGIVAAARDAPKWLVCIVEVASALMFLVSLIAGAAV